MDFKLKQKFNALSHIQSHSGRVIIDEPDLMSEFQKQIKLYQDCFAGRLFCGSERTYPWGRQFEHNGRTIDRKYWKPIIIPPIAKEIVNTHEAHLIAEDKFPTITVTTENTGLFDTDEGNDEVDKALIEKQNLQRFCRAIFDQAELQETMENAVKASLIQKEAPVLMRFYGQQIFLTLPDRKWCDWGFDEETPREIDWYEERYFFHKEGDPKDTYLFRRYIDKTTWTEWEYWIDPEATTAPDLDNLGEPSFATNHNFGSVPVVIVDVGRSVFADEMVDNIKGYIEYRNDIKAGVRNNMDPQWVLLKDPDDKDHALGKPPGQGGEDDAPLERGSLWELRGRQLTSFSNQTEGYKMATDDIEAEKDGFMRAAGVMSIPADNEQSGRALILRMAPQYSNTMRMRSKISKALKELCSKLLKAVLKRRELISLPQGIAIPVNLDNFTVSLDWGQLLPLTPEQAQLELDNTTLAVKEKLISRRTGRRYLFPFWGIDDPEEEENQIQIEEEETQANQMALATAAFNQMKKEDEDGEPLAEED